MNRLDEQKALQMMDLNPDATKEDISRRYGILMRKFRTIKKDGNGYTVEDITNAYNLLMASLSPIKGRGETEEAKNILRWWPEF